MLVPFRNGDLWHLTLESDFLNADEKIESFLSRFPKVETKRMVVFADRESTETDVNDDSAEKSFLKILEVFHSQALEKFPNRLVAFIRVEGVEKVVLVHCDVDQPDNTIKLVIETETICLKNCASL